VRECDLGVLTDKADGTCSCSGGWGELRIICAITGGMSHIQVSDMNPATAFEGSSILWYAVTCRRYGPANRLQNGGQAGLIVPQDAVR